MNTLVIDSKTGKISLFKDIDTSEIITDNSSMEPMYSSEYPDEVNRNCVKNAAKILKKLGVTPKMDEFDTTLMENFSHDELCKLSLILLSLLIE